MDGEPLDGAPLSDSGSDCDDELATQLRLAEVAAAIGIKPQNMKRGGSVSESKLQAFALGGLGKKSRVQVAREAAAAKQRQAEADAAAVYEEFAASFEVGSGPANPPGQQQAFVVGETEGGDDGKGNAARAVATLGQRYVPPSQPKRAAKPRSKSSRKAAAAAAFGGADSDDDAEDADLALQRKKRGPNAGAAFLEELKRKQGPAAAPSASSAGGGGAWQSTSFSSAGSVAARGSLTQGGASGWDRPPTAQAAAAAQNDGPTTNLFVQNLPHTVSELELAQRFSYFGALASVKLWLPRGEELAQQQRSGQPAPLSGFVNFMQRADAEQALDAMHGKAIAGHSGGPAAAISWGQAVAIPLGSVAQYACTGPRANAAERGMNLGSQQQQQARGSASTLQRDEAHGLEAGAKLVLVRSPTDHAQLALIDTTAKFAAGASGRAFERELKKRERGENGGARDRRFAFLFETASPEHCFYMWRAFSLATGATLEAWPAGDFQMAERGPMWRPPRCPIALDPPSFADESGSTFSEGACEPPERFEGPVDDDGRPRIMRGRLSPTQRAALVNKLRGLTVERASIADGLLFALDHSEAAEDVVQVLVDSLTRPHTESRVEAKLARLYLVSDILHNSSAAVPKASHFRTSLHDQLAAVMQSLAEALRSIPGRITAQEMRERVLAVLSCWAQWLLFPAADVANLRQIFIGQRAAAEHGAAQGQPSAKRAKVDDPGEIDLEEEDLDGVELNTSGGYEEQDLDGVALDDDDIDGVPID